MEEGDSADCWIMSFSKEKYIAEEGKKADIEDMKPGFQRFSSFSTYAIMFMHNYKRIWIKPNEMVRKKVT